MSKIIGIDLGTTNSVVAVMQGRRTGGDPHQEGTPHYAFRRGHHQVRRNDWSGRWQAPGGDEPGEHGLFDQRFMGRRYDEVSEEMKRVPYKVVKGDHDDARVEVAGKVYSPPEISAMILTKLKTAAEDFLARK